jgi:hypothetical protein
MNKEHGKPELGRFVKLLSGAGIGLLSVASSNADTSAITTGTGNRSSVATSEFTAAHQNPAVYFESFSDSGGSFGIDEGRNDNCKSED